MTTRTLLLTLILGWPLTAFAQAHSPARTAARAAAHAPADAPRDTGKHAPAAAEPGSHGSTPSAANEHGGSAKASPPASPEHADTHGATAPATKSPAAAPAPHTEDVPERTARTARPAPRPAPATELDVVMGRISKRISQFSGEGGRRAVAQPEEAATHSAVAPRVAAKKPAPERVHLTWMPTVVWPAALLDAPAPAAPGAEDGDDAVRLKWDSLQQ